MVTTVVECMSAGREHVARKTLTVAELYSVQVAEINVFRIRSAQLLTSVRPVPV